MRTLIQFVYIHTYYDRKAKNELAYVLWFEHLFATATGILAYHFVLLMQLHVPIVIQVVRSKRSKH